MGNLSGAEVGCIKSHYNVLLNTRHELTLILEDDFQLCENFDSELEKCLAELPEDFNALWLGGRVISQSDYSESLNRLHKTTGTFGYIIHQRFIPTVLEALAKENKLADWAMSSVFENVFRCKKNLVGHRPGYSTIKEETVVYKDLEL